MNLENKVIIVTGGSGLIGKEIIKSIINCGGIPINLDTDKNSSLCETIKTDICSDTEVSIAIKKIKIKYEKIDGLVNSAYPRTNDWGLNIEKVNKESFIDNLNMQLSSIFSICKMTFDIMKKSRSGSIVNISSIYGSIGFDRNLYKNTTITLPVAYSAVKGGMDSMNRYFASYYGKYNIRSNCISPGGIYNNHESKFVKNYNKKVPLRRMGKPEDIAPAVVFLLSDDSSYLTGQNIKIDGGLTII
tara:strand:+ start:1500 stop:2234 length:735 start_codon:yes stop_codon:yes gene_type:complete